MNNGLKLNRYVLTFLALAACAFAEQPGLRDQFQAAVVAFRKTPGEETALVVAKLYKQLDPPPAVPEEAREPFVMGATVLKKATDPAGANRAADLFTDSLNIAPWFAEAYYNRALAREAGGQFDVAIFNLKVYLEYNLTEAERREAQDKVYSLKADALLAAGKQAEEKKAAAAKAAEADTPQAREAALFRKADGVRFIEHNTPESMGVKGQAYDEIFEIKGQTLQISVKIFLVTGGSIYGHRQPGEFLVDRISFQNGEFTQSFNGFTTRYRIKADGQALIRVRQGGYQSEIPRY